MKYIKAKLISMNKLQYYLRCIDNFNNKAKTEKKKLRNTYKHAFYHDHNQTSWFIARCLQECMLNISKVEW